MSTPSLDQLARTMAQAAWAAERASRAYGSAPPSTDGPTLLRLYNDLKNARARAQATAEAYFFAAELAERHADPAWPDGAA